MAQWLAYLLPDPATLCLIPSSPKIISEEKTVNAAEVNQLESGQWLQNVHWNLPELSSGKLVLQKIPFSFPIFFLSRAVVAADVLGSILAYVGWNSMCSGISILGFPFSLSLSLIPSRSLSYIPSFFLLSLFWFCWILGKVEQSYQLDTFYLFFLCLWWKPVANKKPSCK